MASRPTRLGTNGSAGRKCTSWIESFVDFTSNLDAPETFRRWAAITTIAAALEQKVWFTTSAPLYPNLYVMLVGHPGVGKSRTIHVSRNFLAELSDLCIAPTSMTAASLVDELHESKRFIPRLSQRQEPLEFNSMVLLHDEWGAFMSEWDRTLVDALTTFYDVVIPYSQRRRTADINIVIKAPQLSILAGNTPSKLMKTIPEGAWDEGFCSRLILVFSDERPEGDDFNTQRRTLPEEMVHDLRAIGNLVGEFTFTDGYMAASRDWRAKGYPPTPTHPKLVHYATRRRAHSYKLSMVSSVDRGDSLLLDDQDFNRALSWLIDAELLMPEIFSATVGADAKAMDEIAHMIAKANGSVTERQVVNFARERVPIHAVLRVIEIMEKSGMIRAINYDPKTGLRQFVAVRD